MPDGNFASLHCLAGGQSVEGAAELRVSQGADAERGRCGRLLRWPGYEFSEIVEVDGFEVSLGDGAAGLGGGRGDLDDSRDSKGARQQWCKQPGAADGM